VQHGIVGDEADREQQGDSVAGWTAQQIPDQTGRTVLVTGANSGLGFHTSLELARHGARVLMAARDSARGEQALAKVRAAVPSALVELLSLDLADLSSIGTAAAEVAARSDRLDALVNNAGVMAIPYRQTVDGFEMQFGTNHLGHFALTGLLLPLLLSAPAPRVVTVSSGLHRRVGGINFDDVQGSRAYDKWVAYGQSKLANLLFAAELDRRARTAGTRLVSVAAHPGYASTNLQRVGPQMEGNRLRAAVMSVANRVVAQSDAAGALPLLYAASMPDVSGGQYFGPAGPREMRGHPTLVGRSAAAQDAAAARRLWGLSEELTGVTYGRLDAAA
jgi:NAD(P)-dependent dehydrogenase (short-subunit alcohol dehydrogenase family)